MICLHKQLEPGPVDLLSVVGETLRTISDGHVVALSNRTVRLAPRTMAPSHCSQFIKRSLRQTPSQLFFLISLYTQTPPTVRLSLCQASASTNSPNTHNHSPNLPKTPNHPHSPSLDTLSDRGRGEGTGCLGFFMCLFILPH